MMLVHRGNTNTKHDVSFNDVGFFHGMKVLAMPLSLLFLLIEEVFIHVLTLKKIIWFLLGKWQMFMCYRQNFGLGKICQKKRRLITSYVYEIKQSKHVTIYCQAPWEAEDTVLLQCKPIWTYFFALFKGLDHDDIGFAGVVHFPLYLGFLHLVIETNLVNALFVYVKMNGSLFGLSKVVENFDYD